MYRFYTTSKLTIGNSAILDVEELHHLKKVLRVRPGEKIELVNGEGDLGIATFDETIILESLHKSAKPEKRTFLIQALPEKSHLEIILEKATEIGITDFYFFPSERSKIDVISDALLNRIKKITVSALKQGKRLFLPSITAFRSTSELKNLPSNLYLAHPSGAPFTSLGSLQKGIIVGPESGFTPKEIETFQNAHGAISTTLSPNVLRAETAAIVASYLICN